MEENINIAEILKDKPVGLKLYSPTFGCIRFNGVYKDKVYFYSEDTNAHSVNQYGKMYDGGECIIFPSKEIRDWSKFSWKKGDILTCNNGTREVLFHSWANDRYTKFIGLHCMIADVIEGFIYDEGTTVFNTNDFKCIEDEYAVQCYINTIEERLGEKLNHETLEIENAQPEFKDGDVLFVKCNDSAFIEIFEYYKKNGDLCDHASLDITNQILDISGKYIIRKDEITELRLATEEEKKQFFSALANKGKDWDSEKKKVVNLKPKFEFKPMDLCLMKYIGQYNNRGWELCQYAYTEHRVSLIGEQRDFYHAVGGEIYAECIPYNEDTKHLLGTRDDWKGGEG